MTSEKLDLFSYNTFVFYTDKEIFFQEYIEMA